MTLSLIAADSTVQPPVAKVVPKTMTVLGDTRVDNYFWLRDRKDPDTVKYLEAENAYTQAMMKHTDGLQSKLYAEMLGRIKQTDLSVPVKRDAYFYYTRTEEGKQYPIYCRKHETLDAKEEVRTCTTCHNITDTDPCLYCVGPTRTKNIICVVEEPHNIMAIEKTRTYSGMYHVLGGSLSPLQGRGPDQLHIKTLIERLKGGGVEEIIIATNPTAEGEATAVYMSKLLKPLGVRVTRIGVGIPVGADLEYADEVTMLKAMEGRRDL